MNVVVVAPHPDDETLGCGGAICAHVEDGDSVAVAFLTSGEQGIGKQVPGDARRIREAEAGNAVGLLGVTRVHFLRSADWSLAEVTSDAADRLRSVMASERPALVYTPHPGDAHPDHAVALGIVREALGSWDGELPLLLLYEVWTPLPTYDHVVDITPFFAKKLAALAEYPSQLSQLRYADAVAGLNRYRGALAAGSEYAEVFVYADVEVRSQ